MLAIFLDLLNDLDPFLPSSMVLDWLNFCMLEEGFLVNFLELAPFPPNFMVIPIVLLNPWPLDLPITNGESVNPMFPEPNLTLSYMYCFLAVLEIPFKEGCLTLSSSELDCSLSSLIMSFIMRMLPSPLLTGLDPILLWFFEFKAEL